MTTPQERQRVSLSPKEAARQITFTAPKWVDLGPSSTAKTTATPPQGDGSKGYDVVFTYGWGGTPSHHTFETMKEAQDWAKDFRKGVYSLQDGTLKSIDIVALGNKPATAGKVTFDDKTPKTTAGKTGAASGTGNATKSQVPVSPAAAAQRTWAKNAAAAAQNLQKDETLASALRAGAATSKYLSESDLRTIVSIESTANRATGKNKFGYAGLFQMGKSAAKEAGVRYKDLDEPSEWKTNLKAGVRYLDINAQRLEKAKIDITPLNVYMAHQQGAAGAVKILEAVRDGTAADTPAKNNQLANLPGSLVKRIEASGRTVTVKDYYDYWTAAFRTVSEKVNPPTPLLP